MILHVNWLSDITVLPEVLFLLLIFVVNASANDCLERLVKICSLTSICLR